MKKVEINKHYWHDTLGKVKVLCRSSVSINHVRAERENGEYYSVLIDSLSEITNKLEYPKEMYVWDDFRGEAKKYTVYAYVPELEYPYLVANSVAGEYTGFKHAEDTPQVKELTMQEIADKFNISVEQLKIKK